MQKPVLISVPVSIVSTVPPKVSWSFEIYLYLELTVPQVSNCCPLGRLVMGKVETGIYCYLTADIFIKVLQKSSKNSPLPTIWIFSKPLNLIGCQGNQNAKFAKQYSKIISSEAITGMMLKLCRNVRNISLYKIMFFIAVARVLPSLWQLKVSIDL